MYKISQAGLTFLGGIFRTELWCGFLFLNESFESVCVLFFFKNNSKKNLAYSICENEIV